MNHSENKTFYRAIILIGLLITSVTSFSQIPPDYSAKDFTSGDMIQLLLEESHGKHPGQSP
jgi:hypothetical protein